MAVIVLTQGDDLVDCNLVLNTDVDLTGYKFVFQLCCFQQEWSGDVVVSKRLPLNIPASETKKFNTGPCFGYLKRYDKDGLAKTICKNIEFLIEPEVVKDVK